MDNLNLQKYIGTKIIKAVPMDESTFLENYKNADVVDKETREGYFVQYDNDYESWSPKEVFESHYRKISESETNLINS